MKDIKSVALPKYSGDDYEHIAFRVYHNKKARNYCLTLTSDDMNEFIMDAIMPPFGVSCAEYCGEEKEIDGKTVCIAEFESGGDKLEDLQKILNLASAAGKEIIDFEIEGEVFLCVKTGDVTFPTDGGDRTVPVYSVRDDSYNGMLGFNPRFPDIPFTADMAECIASKGIPGACKYRAVLIQGFRAYLIFEHKDASLAFVYGFDEKKFIGITKGKNMIAGIRGYVR